MNILERGKPLPEAVVQPVRAARPASAISPDDYRYLQNYVYQQSGIVLDHDKHYLMDARLGPIVRKAGIRSVGDLCNLLRGVGGPGKPGAADAIKREVINAITTNETFFFRELAQYDALRTKVLPALMQQRKDIRKLRFWSAAASTGQEAYSLAMLLLELGIEGWNVQIAATDLNDTVLEKAKQGKYLQIEVNRGLATSQLLRYFVRAGAEWQIKEEVRKLVQFETLDLRKNLRSRGPFDIIFCRNVLIYFDLETKRKILAEMRAALYRGGYLLLGGAETTINVDDQFRRVEMGGATLYQVV
jgi:chemotaxis protein methyltransferase CheR